MVLMQVDRPGSSPKRRRLNQVAVAVDASEEFAGLCAGENVPMLSRADPYGTLILTSAEMEQFISEVESRQGRSELLGEILRLARTCMADPSMELHLQGD
ncbi:hypothetical protein A6A06_27180 [Streptomyces sp. CB02923]|nr:hypothetical protein A6A06_27180 [Streptomyces sp. CB02923]